MQEILKSLPTTIFSLKDFDDAAQIKEDGSSPEDNALKKARCHFERLALPTLAVDTGLIIHRFPQHKQPGMFVRRIHGANHDVSDDEMLAIMRTHLMLLVVRAQAYGKHPLP